MIFQIEGQDVIENVYYKIYDNTCFNLRINVKLKESYIDNIHLAGNKLNIYLIQSEESNIISILTVISENDNEINFLKRRYFIDKEKTNIILCF